MDFVNQRPFLSFYTGGIPAWRKISVAGKFLTEKPSVEYSIQKKQMRKSVW